MILKIEKPIIPFYAIIKKKIDQHLFSIYLIDRINLISRRDR